MKFRLVSLILLLCFCATGCVYFNVFYNAKRRFREAEDYRIRSDEDPNDRQAIRLAQEKYLQAITKASAIIELHPDSKYVADCLMLIGKAEFWREHYPDALRKFDELKANFPGSELIEESRLWEGRSYWKLERYTDAQRVLQALTREGKSSFANQAAIVLLQISADQEDYGYVVDEGTGILGHLKEGPLRARIYQIIGEAHLALRDYERALEAMDKVLRSNPSPQLEYRARSATAAIYESKGEFEKARNAYEEMLTIKHLKKGYDPEIRLSLADAYFRMGKDEESFRLCEGVAQDYRHTEQSAKAYYQMGLIALHQQKETAHIKELFTLSQDEKRGAETERLARQRILDVEDLERLRGRIASGPSAEPEFELAELYRLRLGQPDSALVSYQRVAETDTTRDLAPKALYAIGWIQAEVKGDSASARRIFSSLVRDYPGTVFADSAASWLGGRAGAEDTVQAQFERAERLRLQGAHPEDYLPTLEWIFTHFPESSCSAKALYAAALTYENALDDRTTALERYRAVAGKYGKTALGELAGKKVEAMLAESERDSIRAVDGALRSRAHADPSRLAVDSTGAVAQSDSVSSASGPDTSGTADKAAAEQDVVLPPRVVESVVAVYPEGASGRGEVRISLRVLVGKGGRVQDAVVLSGPEDFRKAALETVRHYAFKPGTRNGQAEEMWVEQTVQFTPPAP